MLKSIVHRIQKTLGVVKAHPVAAELKDRQQVAFSVLHPQIQVVKRSPTAQVIVGTIITAAVVSGNWGTAAVVTGCWLGSKPLTHVAAAGVALVGLADSEIVTAIERLQALAAEPA